MNYVAAQAYKAGLFVLAFILMSNHLHFVVAGTRAQVDRFIDSLKGAYSRYMWDKYGVHEVLRRKKQDIRKLQAYDESLERAVAYVQMNSVEANICANSSDYPWGTGASFFRFSGVERTSVPAAGGDRVCGSATGVGRASGSAAGVGRASGSAAGAGRAPELRPGDRRLGDLSARERFRLLHTKMDLPSDWIICGDGYIVPECYVKVDWVEKLYRTPKRMIFFLQNSSKAKKRLATREDCSPSFRDQVILASLPDLCRSLFGKPSVEDLNEEQLSELMRQLRYRFSSNVNQIARVTGLTYERAAMLLDRV